MPKFEYRFDLAGILLASVLAVLGISAANAAGKGGGVGEVFLRGPFATDAAPMATAPLGEGSVATEERRGSKPLPRLYLIGGKPGAQGGDVRSGGFGGGL
jgi:hypothetical protein